MSKMSAKNDGDSNKPKKKCAACGKSPELFWMAVNGFLFCNVGCYADWSLKESKGTKRFEATKEPERATNP